MLAGVFRTIQIGLGVLCAYFIYGAVAPLVTSAALPEPRLPEVATADEATIALAEYGSIAERRLFRTREKPKAEVVVAPTPQKMVESKIPWKLTATVASSNVPELSLATVMNERTRETRAVRVSDKLVDATVERIERGRIVLNNAGKLETLSLADDDEQRAGSGPQAVQAPGTKANTRTVRSGRAGANALRAANLRRARAEAAQQAQQARDEALAAEGSGLAENANEQGEPAEATPDVAAVVNSIGQLRQNEQVISINGIPVDDPARMDELLESMSTGETVMHVRDEDGNERDFIPEGGTP